MYNVWENALEYIKQKISADNFATWFQSSTLISNNNGDIVIGVKNSFFVKQLRSKYNDIIIEALKNSGVDVKSVDYEVVSTKKPKVKSREVVSTPTEIKKITKVPKKSIEQGNGLNEKYTLSTFVVGSNNDLAYSVAKSIINEPGKKVNPFFLYGGPGLGKTHLVQAIGNELVHNNPSINVLYVTINHFYQEFIDDIKAGRGKDFYKKYSSVDCLIIDDFQQIMNKEKSQEEFFNIFNDLYQANHQIIVTSDRLPSQIKTVDERLATRLVWAGAYDLQLPKFEDKCAILKAKAELMGAEIEQEAIEYLAENINTNIRELEGELSKLLLMSDVRNLTPWELIQNGSATFETTSRFRPTTSKQILEKVAKQYDITVKELCSKSRVSNIKTARQVAMFLLSKELSMSTPKIAKEVNVKDHTTVMHGIKKINSDLRLDFSLRDQIESIKEKIYG